MKVDALSQHSPPSRSEAAFSTFVGGQLLGGFERRDIPTLRRGAHGVHEARRAKRSRTR